MTTTTALGTHRMRPADLARLSVVGMRTRKLRAALSALGIAIGVAAIVAVLGLSVVLPGRAAERDQQTGHQPAHRRQRANPQRRHRRAPGRRTRHDRPDRPGHRRGRHRRRQQRQRLPQPADPLDQHQRPVRAGHQPRPARTPSAPRWPRAGS